MASTVTRFSQRSPVTQINGYFFLLPVIGTETVWAVSGPTAPIGLRPLIRGTARTARSSFQAAYPGKATTGTTADPSVSSQNKKQGGSAVRCSEASKSWGCKASAQHPRQNLGEADII